MAVRYKRFLPQLQRPMPVWMSLAHRRELTDGPIRIGIKNGIMWIAAGDPLCGQLTLPLAMLV